MWRRKCRGTVPPAVITFERMRDYAVQFGVTIEEKSGLWRILRKRAATKQLTGVECAKAKWTSNGPSVN